MYTIERYIKDTFVLAKSIKIKIAEIATAINNSVVDKYNVTIPVDKTEWKYYLNLSGEKHFTNNDIVIHSIDTNTDVIMTKDIINTHPLTYDNIITNKDVYLDIILKYPEDKEYIDGMIYPVDINKAIEASNGTILTYRRDYIEDNELDLIRLLEERIINFLNRWHIKDYVITDELYLTSMLALLYGTIPNHIFNIRLSKLNTNQVHSFHLEHYFRSRLDIWDDLQVLNKESIMWLYNNIDYLMKHVGKDVTLSTIIDKIFSVNKIGIGEVLLNKSDLTLSLDNQNNVYKYVSEESVVKLTNRARNKEYTNDEGTDRNIKTTVSSEMTNDVTINTDIIKNSIDYYITMVEDQLSQDSVYKQRTKLLDINSYNIFKLDNDITTQVVIDNFVWYGFNDTNNFTTKFKDPNTLKYYNLTPKTGVLFLFKLMMDLFDSEVPISNYSYFSLLKDDLTYDDLNRNTLSPLDNEYLLNTILGLIPEYPTNINRPEVFEKYIGDVIDYYIKVNVITSNIQNTTLVTTTKVANEQIMQRGNITISTIPKTPSELLLENDVFLEIDTRSNYDYKLSIVELLKTFTGVDIDKYAILDNYITSFINILNKLTSYTTQVTKNIEDSDPITTQYNNVNINNTSQGIVTLLDAEITHALEPEMVWNETIANDFEEGLKYIDIDDNIYSVNMNCGLEGIIYDNNSKNNINSFLLQPTVMVEVVSKCINYYRPKITVDDINKKNDIQVFTNGYVNSDSKRSYQQEVNYSNTLVNNATVAILNEPNVMVEVLNEAIDYYSPTTEIVDINNTNTVDNINLNNNSLTTNNAEIQEVVYSDTLINNETVAILNEPNVTVEVTKDINASDNGGR